jgi:hypothetical protein
VIVVATLATQEAAAKVYQTTTGYLVHFAYPPGVSLPAKPPREYVKRGAAIRSAQAWVE